MELHVSDDVCHESLKKMREAQDREAVREYHRREARRKEMARKEMENKSPQEYSYSPDLW